MSGQLVPKFKPIPVIIDSTAEFGSVFVRRVYKSDVDVYEGDFPYICSLSMNTHAQHIYTCHRHHWHDNLDKELLVLQNQFLNIYRRWQLG